MFHNKNVIAYTDWIVLRQLILAAEKSHRQ